MVNSEKPGGIQMSETGAAHIAMIDDDPLVREGLKDCMESAGYSVDALGSAEEFLDWDSSCPPVCLVVDIQLPGMSGLELQRRLVASGSRTPIVFVTAHGTDSNRQQALKNGAAAVLPKPIRREQLLNAVRAATNRYT